MVANKETFVQRDLTRLKTTKYLLSSAIAVNDEILQNVFK